MDNTQFYEGQRIYYSGMTTYHENVRDEPASIVRIYPLGTMDIVLDEKRRITVEVIPKEQRAFVTPADLLLNLASITPIWVKEI